MAPFPALRTDRGQAGPACPAPHAGNSQPVGERAAPPHSNKNPNTHGNSACTKSARNKVRAQKCARVKMRARRNCTRMETHTHKCARAKNARMTQCAQGNARATMHARRKYARNKNARTNKIAFAERARAKIIARKKEPSPIRRKKNPGDGVLERNP